MIADYPQSGFKVDDIWPNCAPDWTTDEQKDFTLSEMANYPHLFQPLPWYAERKPEEAPEYIKYFAITKQHVHKVNKWCGEYAEVDGGIVTLANDVHPATSSEYLSYIKSKP